MGIRTDILKASFRSRFYYELLNEIMINKLIKQQEEEKQLMADKATVISENDLQLIETEFFRRKKTVARVKDAQNSRFILKTGGIEPFQIQLLKAAKLIENQLYFRVPAIIKQGKGWVLLEEIDGQFLNDFYDW